MIVDARDKNIPTKFIGCTITLKLHLAYITSQVTTLSLNHLLTYSLIPRHGQISPVRAWVRGYSNHMRILCMYTVVPR